MKPIFKLAVISGMALFAANTGANAQSRFTGGVEAGVGISFPADHLKGCAAGWYAGVTGEYEISREWGVEGALRLASKPGDGGIGILPDGETDINKASFCTHTNPVYLNIPIRAGYRLGLGDDFSLRLSVGPYFGAGLFGKSKWVSASDNGTGINISEYERNLFGSDDEFAAGIMRRFEVGVSGRAEVRYKGHYGIAIEYTRQFNSMYKGNLTGMHNQVFSVGLTYTL